MQLETFLEQSAKRLPTKAALVCGDRRVTYAEIERQSNALAGGLRDAGVERGDRVVVFLDNSVEAAVSIFAVLKAGAAFSVINPTTKAHRLNLVLNNCRAKALISHAGKLATIREAVSGTPYLAVLVLAGEGAEQARDLGRTLRAMSEIVSEPGGLSGAPPNACIDIDLASLIYTSGSTGNPKGVTLTHLNMVAAATSITSYLEITESEIILSVLPLSFDYGLYQLLMAFKAGATLIQERSFTYPHVVLTRIAQEKVTGFPIVPTISSVLLQMDLSKYDLSTLRYVTNTAAALPTEHVVRLRRALPWVRLYSMYGLTECKRVSYLPPDQVDKRPSSVGKAMPNVEAYVVDDEGKRLPPGSVGELVVRGSNVMKGYWEMPEETGRMLRPGPLPGERVLYTGDLFEMDEEGYLYFLGRRDDMLKSRGEKVSPREVEDVLYRLDGVAEAAVVGVPDPVLGQAVKAFVVLRQGASVTREALLAHCVDHLEDFKIPKILEFLDAFPKTPSGKIDKKALALRGA